MNSSIVVMQAGGRGGHYLRCTLLTRSLLIALRCAALPVGARHSAPPAASHIKGVGCAEPSVPWRRGIKQPIQ